MAKPKKKPAVDELLRGCSAILKKRRERLGLTQQELADQIGKNKSAIGKIEAGPLPNMQIGSLMEVSHALGLSLPQLLSEAAGESIDDRATPGTSHLRTSEKEALRGLAEALSKSIRAALERFEKGAAQI